MKGVDFPIVGTKVPGLSKKFNLSDPKERAKYFQAKAGPEIKKLKKFLKKKRFIANLVGKKNSGKGTRAKIFTEIFGTDSAALIGVGDIIRDVHGNWEDFAKSKELDELKKHYRGFITFDEAVDRLHGRTTSGLLPTEFILALVKFTIAKNQGKALFIDGLPRDLDQVSYSLFLRDLVNYSSEPDLFILIDIPESVIAERIKYRVVCPVCKDPRNLKLLPTNQIGYDAKTGEFYLKCDNPKCKGARMIAKEGDELGIDPIRERLDKDEQVMKLIYSLHGVPIVTLRNAIPAELALKHFDDYEVTPEYSYELDQKTGKVNVKESLWTIKDDNGVVSHSLLPYPHVVLMIKQLVRILDL